MSDLIRKSLGENVLADIINVGIHPIPRSYDNLASMVRAYGLEMRFRQSGLFELANYYRELGGQISEGYSREYDWRHGVDWRLV